MHFVLDLHRTLLFTKTSHGRFLRAHFSHLSDESFDTKLGEALFKIDRDANAFGLKWVLNGPDPVASRRAWTRLLREVAETCIQNPSDVSRALEEVCGQSYDRLASPDGWDLANDATDTLSSLLANGHSLSILSNFDVRGDALVRALLPDIPWRRVDLSFRTGLLKPERSAFVAHCRLLGEDPARVVMVGDDSWQDGGAVSAGLSFLQVGYPDSRLRHVLEGHLNG